MPQGWSYSRSGYVQQLTCKSHTR